MVVGSSVTALFLENEQEQLARLARQLDGTDNEGGIELQLIETVAEQIVSLGLGRA